ncbi:glycosyltransferase family 4 protein [Solirubrobacter ginsenosidimutans]|uniref:Glycosyltransferase family 4 protein n=1 Tax=Solirubrobacter ginsenosidimutans TaxID=490573 RepID=A0A9X3N0G7_9ACTN|nr:glycosyltransferase family 4 protein [Solirubrobacter ginsenosidimutans]MDA0164735.1 glycosyltransferase family 4 protein [Solirubrobacter ginsenosidimutans]
MRVAFLTQDLQLSGGVGVIVAHAVQLARHGFEVDLVLTRSSQRPDWSHHGLADVNVLSVDEARKRRYDVALATWWETTEQLLELDAARHACFVQSLEDRFYDRESPWRVAAGLALDLPVRFVTEARWIADTLEALNPGEKVFYVRNGIAKDLFPPLDAVPIVRGPLRILIEGSARVSYKGVGEALAATAAMTGPRQVTVVAGDGSGGDIAGADRVAGPLTQRELASLYAETDVLLKLSRVEGMFGPPLEGFHQGATCVVTPVTGYDEYVVHGENGLVVDWDDPAGTARALDLLAADPVLLHRLRCGALATARSWPSWEQQGQVMAAALLALRREPPPSAAVVARRLSRDLAGARCDGERLASELAAVRGRAASAQASRAYRLAVRGRTTVENVLRYRERRRKRLRGEI